MASYLLVPMSAKASGMDYPSLCVEILRHATRDYAAGRSPHELNPSPTLLTELHEHHGLCLDAGFRGSCSGHAIVWAAGSSLFAVRDHFRTAMCSTATLSRCGPTWFPA
jgi:hypothetical protein